MARPFYISTEWEELGHAILHFRPKKGSTHASKMHVIDCYLSAVYIQEYGERKRQAAKGCEETSEPQVDLVKTTAPNDRQESNRRPPGVAPEVWKEWQEYWEAWKEILIPLSFVHNYRDQCTPEHIEWHDSYLQNFPDVLALITDDLGKNEWSEKTKQSPVHETYYSYAELDNVYCENYQHNQNGNSSEEPVDGKTELSVDRECASDKLKRNECKEEATIQSPEHKTSHTNDDIDLMDFYDYIYDKDNEQDNQNCSELEAAEIEAMGTSVEQKYAPGGVTCMDISSESSGGKNEKKSRKILDELYEKHEDIRYWVHLHSFLLDRGVEYGPDIEAFFEREAGIRFSTQSSTRSFSGEMKSPKKVSPVTDDEAHEGEQEGKEICSQSKAETVFIENGKIPAAVYASDNSNEHKNNISHISFQCDKENNQKWGQEQIEDLKAKTMENVAGTSTTVEVFLDDLSDLQELGNNNHGKENLSHNSRCQENKSIELGVMEAGSSISDEGSMETVEADSIHSTSSLDQQQKTSGKRKRKRKMDVVRPQGLSWALRYIQKQDNVSAEEPGRSSGTAPMSFKSHEYPEATTVSSEAVLGSHEAVPRFPETVPGSCDDFSEADLGSPEMILLSPDAAPESPEASPGSPEASPGSPETALESPEACPQSPEAAPQSPEAAPASPEAATAFPESSDKMLSTEEVDTSDDDSMSEEGRAIQMFLEEMAEKDKEAMKKYIRMGEEKAQLQDSSSQQVTIHAQVLATCQATMDKAAAALRKMFVPLTALHCLNLSFPGAAAIEYESSVTEQVPGERRRLKFRFDSFVDDTKERLKRLFNIAIKFFLSTWMNAVVPAGLSHLTKLAFPATPETELQFPPTVFGMRWLPEPEPSFHIAGKNVQRCLRRFHNWLKVHDPNLLPQVTVELRGLVMNRINYTEDDPRKAQRVYQQVVEEEEEEKEGGCPRLTLHTLHLLEDNSKIEEQHFQTGDSEGNGEVEWPSMEVTFDQDGNFCVANVDSFPRQSEALNGTEESKAEAEAKAKAEAKLWQRIISGSRRLTFWETGNSLPPDLPQEINKYWAQRYRLFLKYDEGIKLDTESWYSVTPELLAAHHARRCSCEVVVDALCGAGGNAIQLAKTCGHVIAIDKDPNKVRLARHNAEVYGVAHRIDFRVGDFFKLAPSIKADVVFLSPPWGGMEYLEENVYNVYRLGGTMNCVHLLRAAQDITPNVALYLPRNSNLCQVIALAGVGGVVDIETNFMGPKKKAITAYFGDLATKAGWCEC